MIYPSDTYAFKLVSHDGEDIAIMVLRLCGEHIHRHFCSHSYIALDTSKYKISYVAADKSAHCALSHYTFHTGEPHCRLGHWLMSSHVLKV